MNKKYSIIIAIGLILIAALSRLFPIFPNFQPVTALALFAGAIFFSNRFYALLVPLAAMLISDTLLHFFSESLLGYYAGFHYSTLIVYFSVGLIALIGSFSIRKINFKNVIISSISSAILFFILTNLGSWLFGLDITNTPYQKSFAGFIYCFSEALPFFRYTLASTLVYSGLMFGVWSISVKSIEHQTAKI